MTQGHSTEWQTTRGHCSEAASELRVNIFTTGQLGLHSAAEVANWTNRSENGQSCRDYPATFRSNVRRQQNCRW